MKNVVFFVHGIGRHGENWSTAPDGPVTALDEAMKRYSCFEGRPLSAFADIIEVRYDDLFDLVLAKWEELADSLGPVAGNIPWVAKVTSLLGDVGGNKNQFADFGGDVLLYRGFDLVARAVRLRVAAMISGEVFRRNMMAQEEGLSGTLPKVVIVAHSMGTAVVRDALWTIVSASFPEDKKTLRKRLPKEKGLVDLGMLSEAQAEKFAIMEATASSARSGPLPFFVDRLMLVANTIPLIACAPGDYLTAKFQNDFQCKSITNVKHELDPVCLVKSFEMPNHPDAAEIAIKHLHDRNIHGFAHYLGHPTVHANLFRAAIDEFKLKDLAESRKLAAQNEWNGIGGNLAELIDAKKTELLERLRALLGEGDLLRLAQTFKGLQGLKNGGVA